MKYIIAAAATGTVFTVLSYLNQGQGRDMFTAILAAAAIVFYVLCVCDVFLALAITSRRRGPPMTRT